jgi:hypothetical protein
MNFDLDSVANGLGFAAVSGMDKTDSLLDEDIGVHRGSDGEILVEQVEAFVKLPSAILKNRPPAISSTLDWLRTVSPATRPLPLVVESSLRVF